MLKSIVVVGNSMYPTLQDGDIAIVATGNHNFKLGDIIVYCRTQQGVWVIHRIEAACENEFITRGDGNQFHDPEFVTREQIIGKVCFVISCLRWLVKKVRKKEEGR